LSINLISENKMTVNIINVNQITFDEMFVKQRYAIKCLLSIVIPLSEKQNVCQPNEC
jgi:hypothetical protein